MTISLVGTPYYDDGTVRILHGDCRELLGDLRADVVVTDPPYGLAFMGKAWDKPTTGFHEAWARAALQALPPGGWLLAFGGTRTWHRLACGIEDAGFEIRDTTLWLYGQGFPKGRACLKPGWEPILLARKPGSSVLQIDACRIDSVVLDSDRRTSPRTSVPRERFLGSKGPMPPGERHHPAGRWPANVVLSHGEGCQPVGVRKVRGTAPPGQPSMGADVSDRPYYDGGFKRRMPAVKYADPDGTETVEAWECEPDCPVFLLDQQSGILSTHGTDPGGGTRADTTDWRFRKGAQVGDKGGASRFFYTAKAGRNERVTVDGESHPTVKPLALMRWLVRLVTPPGGTVLDPFCGSGSTLVAAALEGFRAVGVEADERWCRGAAKRVAEIPPVQQALGI